MLYYSLLLKYYNIGSRLLYLVYLYVPILIKIWRYGLVPEYITELKFIINESGPLFIKIIQWLSQRRDILHPIIFKEFRSLQTACKEYPLNILEHEISNEIYRFNFIEKKPLGVGSIAQVHRARLNDGTNCIIKIRHPNIINLMEMDIIIFKIIIKILSFKYKNLVDAIDIHSILKNINEQLYFKNEKINLDHLRHVFRRDKTVKFPEIIYCSDNLIIETECHGTHINLIKQNSDEYIKAKYIIFDAYIKMIRSMFIHGDLHDGNILYDKGSIYLLDYGIAIELEYKDRKAIRDLLKAYYIFYRTGECERIINIIQNFTVSEITEENKDQLRNKLLSYSIKVEKDGQIKRLLLTNKISQLFEDLFIFFNMNKIYLRYNIIYILLLFSIIEADITNEFQIDFIGNGFKKYIQLDYQNNK